MAITAEARSELITLVVAMFNAAPGAVILEDLAAARNEGFSLKDIANALANSDQFKAIYPPNAMTNSEFATKLVNSLVGNLVTDANKAAGAAELLAALNAGMSRVDVVIAAVTALQSAPADNADWGAARVAFDNKVEVATYYSVDKGLSANTVAELQAVIANVDNTDASVATAKGEADGEQTAGQTFTLTTGQNAIEGTSGDDTIIGLVGTGATFTLGDVINGGNGNDTLSLTSDSRTVSMALADISNVENVRINQAATGAPGTAGTPENATTVNLNSVAFERAVIAGVTGDDATTVNSDTLTVNNANKATRVVLESLADVAATVNFAGATGSSDTATVEIAGATDDTTVGRNNNLTVGAIETLNLAFTTKANSLNTVSAAQATTLNVSVASGANTTWAAAAALSNVKALDIKADGNLTLSATADLANDVAITVSGKGNVSLGTLDIGKTLNGNTVNAGSLTGNLTVTGSADTASITGGSGADKITSGSTATTIVAGDGNDYVSIGALNYGAAGAKTVSGGAGTNTLNITDGTNLTAATLAKVTGFQVLSIGGSVGNAYNAANGSFTGIVVDADIAATAVNGIKSESVTITATTTAALTLALADATGTSDALTVSISGAAAASKANDLTVAGITTTGIETITVSSNTAATNTSGVENKLTALTTDATKLIVTGNHALEIDGLDANTTITSIDASNAKSLEMLDAVKTTSAVSLTGSAGADVLKIDALTTGGSTINAGKGGDSITLGVNGARDTLIVNSGDSKIGYVDTNKDNTYTAAADQETFDIVTGFTTGEDLLDLGAFGFTGQAQSALAAKTLTPAQIVNLINGTTASIDNFFVDTGVQRGVAIVSNIDASTFGGAAGSTVVFIDTDKNGSLSAGDDMIVLSGTASVALADFGF